MAAPVEVPSLLAAVAAPEEVPSLLAAAADGKEAVELPRQLPQTTAITASPSKPRNAKGGAKFSAHRASMGAPAAI